MPNVLKDSPRHFIGRAKELQFIERCLPLDKVTAHGTDELPAWLAPLPRMLPPPQDDKLPPQAGIEPDPPPRQTDAPLSNYAVLITAPPGAGKSSLLQAFIKRATDAGRTALRIPAPALATDNLFAEYLRDNPSWKALRQESESDLRRRIENGIIAVAEGVGLGALAHYAPDTAQLPAPFQGTIQNVVDAVRDDRTRSATEILEAIDKVSLPGGWFIAIDEAQGVWECVHDPQVRSLIQKLAHPAGRRHSGLAGGGDPMAGVGGG